MKTRLIVSIVMGCIFIFSPMFAARADKGRNSLYYGFSCQPTGPVQVGIPILLELVALQNTDLKKMGVDHLKVSAWTYGDIEYNGPMNFEIDLRDSLPSVFPFTVIVQPAESSEELTYSGVSFTITSDQTSMTKGNGDKWDMVQYSYFWQFEDSISHTPVEPREANWKRLGVPEWVKKQPHESSVWYHTDTKTGKRTELTPSENWTGKPPTPAPPDTGYTTLRQLTKIEAAQSKMRKLELHPLEDQERQTIEVDGVWYVRDRGEKSFVSLKL